MATSYIKPKLIEFKIGLGYTINCFCHPIIVNNIEIYEYVTENIKYVLSYDNIISVLINTKYSQDQITAITLNYLLTLHEEVLESEKIKEYQQEYKELQEYRAACKAEAKKVLEYADINDIGPKL